MNEYLEKVKESFEKSSKDNGLNRYAKAVLPSVKEALLSFCEQEQEFAQAIIESGKSLSECCTKITEGVSGSISDIELYRRAVQFYFDGADISFTMQINLCASVEDAPKSMKLSIFDLM